MSRTTPKLHQHHLIQQFIKYMSLEASLEETHQGIKKELTFLRKYALEKGACNGFSITQSAMNALGKRQWLEDLLKQIAQWDGTNTSLQKIIPLTDENPDKPDTQKTLGYYFKQAISYVLFHQAMGDQTDIPALSQENLFESWFSEKVYFQKKFSQQDQTVESLASILDPAIFSQEKAIFLLGISKKTLGFFESRHLCGIRFDQAKQLWCLYDPNDSEGEQFFKNIAALYYTLSTRYKTTTFSVDIISFNKDFQSLPDATKGRSTTEKLISLETELQCLEIHYQYKLKHGETGGFDEGVGGKLFSVKTRLEATQKMRRSVQNALSEKTSVDISTFGEAEKNGKLGSILKQLEKISLEKTTSCTAVP